MGSRNPLRRSVPFALPLLLVPATALADDRTANPGITASAGVLLGWPLTAPNRGDLAIGGEASLMYYPWSTEQAKPEAGVDWGFGGFAQGEALAHHGRFALGAQAGKWYGLELGGALRTADGTHAGDVDLHTALFLSAGIVGLDLRATLPLAKVADSFLPSLGSEVAIVLTLKAPFLVHNVGFLTSMLDSGRRLRDGDHALTAGLATREEPRPRRERDPLAELAAAEWAQDGLAEHASIPAFTRLAAELDAVGAPPSLGWRARRASGQEVAHTQLCFAAASALAGQRIGPTRCPAPRSRRPSIEQIAVEAWVDGCVGEGTAALVAREAAATTRAPALRRILERIGRDEAEHEALSWDIVAWARHAGGAPVARALARAELAPLVESSMPPLDLSPFGRLPRARTFALRDAVIDRAIDRRLSPSPQWP
jgi:hypothetical protein